ncbi:MAG: ATP-binding protein [Hyphomicrobiales bacterium]
MPPAAITFWMIGPPGAGKSMLARRVPQSCRPSNRRRCWK